MSDQINVEPANLREAALRHRDTAEQLRALPSTHAAILESLDSLGTVFGEMREAGRQLLEQRRLCYQQQAEDHADLAEKLTLSAQRWEQHVTDAARQFRGVTDH